MVRNHDVVLRTDAPPDTLLTHDTTLPVEAALEEPSEKPTNHAPGNSPWAILKTLTCQLQQLGEVLNATLPVLLSKQPHIVRLDDKDVFTIDEAAQILQVTVACLRRWINERVCLLPSKVGVLVRYHRQDIIDYLKVSRIKPREDSDDRS